MGTLKLGDLGQVWENTYILTSLSGAGNVLLLRACINVLERLGMSDKEICGKGLLG